MSRRTLEVIHGTPDAMISKAREYMSTRVPQDKPATYNGLANHLGVTLQTLRNYASADDPDRYTDGSNRDDPAWQQAAKLCLGMVDEEVEALMYVKGMGAGPIFALKNRGWTDQMQIEQRVSFTDLRCLFGDVLTTQIAPNAPQTTLPRKADNVPDAVLIDSKPAPE